MNKKKELQEILAQHQLWLDSAEEEGSRADLREADLRGACLRGACLYGAILYRADLSGAYLTGANLNRADLREADLRGAYLSGAYLSGAFLSWAKLGPEIRECSSFRWAKVSEDQLAWLCLHPKFSGWVSGLEIV